jgi:hypothetical protein
MVDVEVGDQRRLTGRERLKGSHQVARGVDGPG